MSAPIRYEPDAGKDHFGYRAYGKMTQSADGDYVSYADYAALEAQAGEQYHAAAQLAEAVVRITEERDKLTAQNQQLREALEAIIRRVALVSPYYEVARAALAATEKKP